MCTNSFTNIATQAYTPPSFLRGDLLPYLSLLVLFSIVLNVKSLCCYLNSCRQTYLSLRYIHWPLPWLSPSLAGFCIFPLSMYLACHQLLVYHQEVKQSERHVHFYGIKWPFFCPGRIFKILQKNMVAAHAPYVVPFLLLLICLQEFASASSICFDTGPGKKIKPSRQYLTKSYYATARFVQESKCNNFPVRTEREKELSDESAEARN